MKIFETIQRAEGGGHPLDNDNGVFTHGDSIVVLEHREFLELLYELCGACQQQHYMLPEISRILRAAGGFEHSNGAWITTHNIGKEAL